MLKIKELNAGYLKFQVLFDITTQIEKGKIVAIIGPNGSGKSTLIKTVMGLTQIYSGKIFFKNKDITGLPVHLITREGISYLPQVGNIFENLTVKENLMLSCYMLDEAESRERIMMVVDEFPMLRKYMNKKCKFLSGGERKMLAMAMALVRKPELMLFDEPTAGLAPKVTIKILDKIQKLREEKGITVVIIEQAAKKALEVADDVILLVSGRISYQGKAKDLLTHPELGKVYLGLK